VLDIGAWDGWFSFEMERRGAEVLAIDNWDNPRFHQARAMLNSRVDYRQMDIYEAHAGARGYFDIVLFMVCCTLEAPIAGTGARMRAGDGDGGGGFVYLAGRASTG